MLNTLTKSNQFRMVGIINEYSDTISTKRVSSGKYFAKTFFKNPFGIIGVVVLSIILLFSLIVPLMSKQPNEVYFDANGNPLKHLPSEAGHILGTDAYGRDIWTRLWYGIRFSLGLGAIVLVFTLIIGGLIGILMGYFPMFDRIMRYVIQLFYNIPDILIYMVLLFILSPVTSRTLPTAGMLTLQYAFMFSLFTWMSMALQVRSQVLRIKTLDFVTASRILGTPRYKIIANFIPAVLPIALTQLVLIVPLAILNEATLGVIGASANVAIPTLGTQLSEALPFTSLFPAEVLIPVVGLVLVTVSIYFIANGIQQSLQSK